jgi:hypothetical protein
VYRPDGTCLGYLSTARMLWLHAQYCSFRSLHPSLYAPLTSGSFARDLADLLLRYPVRRSAPAPPPNRSWLLPAPLLRAASFHFGPLTHLFATPLTAPLTTTAYHSASAYDALFGASPNAYSTAWVGTSFAFPPYTVPGIIRAVRWAQSSASSTTLPSCTLMLLPHWPASAFSPMLQQANVCVLATYTPSQLRFFPPCYTSGLSLPPHGARTAPWPV